MNINFNPINHKEVKAKKCKFCLTLKDGIRKACLNPMMESREINKECSDNHGCGITEF